MVNRRHFLFILNLRGQAQIARAMLMGLLLYVFGQSAQAGVTGYSSFSGNTTTAPTNSTNLNQDTAYAMRWGIQRLDSTYFSHDTASFNHQITFQVAGSYEVSFSIPLQYVNGSNRRSIRGELYLNGSPIDIGRAESSYIRNANGHKQSSLHLRTLLANISAGDTLELRVSKQTNQTGDVTTTGAQLFLQYVDPLTKTILVKGAQSLSGTNLNTESASDMSWDETIVSSSAFSHNTVSSSNVITIQEAGSYRLALNIPLQDATACANGTKRTAVKALVNVDGVTVRSGQASQGYIRCLDNHQAASIHWFGFLHNLAIGQKITVSVLGEANTTQTVQVASSRKASLYIDKLTATNKIISLYGDTLTTGTDWNPSGNARVNWSAETLKDDSIYAHSTSSNSDKITINQSGDYLILYADALTSTAERTNVGIQLRKNGSLSSGAECLTHYIRNGDGHNESSCTISYLMENVSAGDIIDVGAALTANSGVVNNLKTAEIHIFQVSAHAPILDINSIPNKAIHYDMSNPLKILDSSSRNGNDLSFSGTAATLLDISGSASAHDSLQDSAAKMPSYTKTTSVLHFDGVNDYFQIQNATDINTATTSERTFAMVLRTGSDVDTRQVIYEEGASTRGINVYIRNGSLYLGFWNDTDDGDEVQSFVSTNTPITPSTNYYVTLVYDYSNYTGPNGPNGALRGTINGTPFSFSGSTTSRLYSHGGAIGLGAMNGGTCYDDGCSGGNGDYFGGDIFEFIMYNAAISPALELTYYNFLSNKWPDPFPVTNLALASQYTNTGTTSPNVSWSASISTDVSDYELAIGTTVGGVDISPYTNVGNITSTQITGLSLTECTPYYISARAIDPQSNASTVKTTNFFKYDGTAPSDPGVISLNGSASSSVSKNFSWTASSDSCGFKSYEVALGSTSAGSDIVTWTDIGNVLNYQFTGVTLSNATDYYVSVRAKDNAGNLSAATSSVAWQVSTCVANDVTAPTDPSSLSISGAAGSSASPTLSWSGSTDSCGFSHYELSIGTTAGASDVVPLTNVGDILSYKFFSISPSLSTNTNYYTSIKAVDLAGNSSNIVSSSAWTIAAPGNVSGGVVLWLDAADNSTLFQNSDCVTGPVSLNGDPIGCWKDKSISGFNATASSTARPLYKTNQFNGKSVIRFDGVDDALDFTSINTIRTVFIVNKSSATTYQPFMGSAEDNTDWFTNDTSLIGTGSSSFLQNGIWRVNQTNISQPTLTTQSGQYSLYSVVSSGNVVADHLSSDRKMTDHFFKGDYVEVIIYNRALSDIEVKDVENYLYYKWLNTSPAPLTGLSLSSSFTNTNNITPTLSWTNSNAVDLDHYEVALGQTAGTNDTAGWINNGLTNQYNFSGTTLAECTNYYISARAANNNALVGSATSSSAFKYDGTAPGAPASLNLSGNASSTSSPTLTWGSATDTCSPIHYEVSLGTSSGVADVANWLNVGTVNSYQFSGQSLSNATNYYFNIRASDGAGNLSSVVSSSAFQVASCVATDVTAPTAPSSPALVGQADLSNSPLVNFTSGSDSCGFSHHEIALGTTTSSTDVVNWKNIGTSSSYQFTNIVPELNRGINYYINIRSVDLAGNISSITSTNAFILEGPGAVSPTGIEIWVDTSDANGVFSDNLCSTPQANNNGEVGCLKDFSGKGNNLSISALANKPSLRTNAFNSKKSVYFDGATNEFLKFKTQLTNMRTVFWVLKEDASNLGDTAMLLGDSAGSTSDFLRASTGGPILSASSSASVRDGVFHLNKNVIDGTITNMPTSEAVLSLVTTENTTADSFSQDRVSCCGGRTFGGQLAELIIYNRALTSVEVSDIENYLMTKWNLVSSSTQWTGEISTDWFNAGNWSNDVPTASLDCIIPDQLNDPIITASGAQCRSLTITNGNLTFQSSVGASLAVYNDIEIQTGSLLINDGSVILSDNGSNPVLQSLKLNNQPINLTFNKSAGSSVEVDQNSTFNSFTMPAGSNFNFIVKASTTSTFPNGLTVTGGIFNPESGAIIKIGDGKILTLNGGVVKTVGLNDPLGESGQDMTKKVTFTSVTGAPWAFTATSGIVDLVGFHFKYLDANGLYIGGNTNLLNLDGGQFSYLQKDYTTPAKGIYLDTTAVISESIAVNVGFNWGAENSGYAGNPLPSDNYYTVYAPNCGDGTLVFDQWFGDFWGAPGGFDTELKIFDNADGGNCNVSMDIAVSPVTLTEFKVTPYDKAVVINWTTGSELDHLGFNLYRSTNPDSGYVQINNELIRNYLSSGEFRGRYRFVDPALTNNQIYYYILEDVATNGDRVPHGPLYTMPIAAAGDVPSVSSGVNTPVTNPSSVNLGGGVALLSQTNSSFRISINPAALILNTASWNTGYVQLAIPGYSSITKTGAPELLTRRILVPVDGTYSNIQYTLNNQNVSDISGILSGKKISPVPNFVTDTSGKLVTSYSEDTSIYTMTSNYPSNNYFTVNPQSVNILGKNYVEILVSPLLYAPANNGLMRLDQLVLDIGLNAPAWNYTPPSDIYRISPYVAEDTLTIKYKKEGIYKITFNQLVASNLDAPFNGKDLSLLRMFYHGKEIPIEITSADNFFNAGDEIIFYGPYDNSPDDLIDSVVLAPYNFSGGDIVSEDSLRLAALVPGSGNYSGTNDKDRESILFDQNNYAVFDIPVGLGQEHLFLKRIFTAGGAVPNDSSSHSESINITNIDPHSETIQVKINLLSRKVVSENPVNHIRLSVNGVSFTDHIFQDDAPLMLTFNVPVSYFVSGANTIKFTTLGDMVSAGDFDMVNIERVTVNYDQLNSREGVQSIFEGGKPGEKFTAWNFLTNSLRVFDITSPQNFFEYAGPSIDSFDGGSTYQVGLKNLTGSFGVGGKRKIIIEGNNYLAPFSMKLNQGVAQILSDSTNDYEYIIISSDGGMNAAQRLADYRMNNGMKSLAISLKQVYGEFSNGQKDEFAINKFLQFAKDNWVSPPKYLLIIGDMTYDPRDDLGFAGKGTNPVLLYKGQENDFGSDAANGLMNLGNDEESKDPYLAIGRLPTDDSFLIESYVQKVIDYENGTKAPDLNVKKGIFIAGTPDTNENFSGRVNSLVNTMISANSQFSSSVIDSSLIGNSVNTKAAVVDAFNQAPLFLTYLGHGAEDLWGISGFFNTNDADQLSNARLPIVMGLGCLNNYYYDPDPTWKSLAEEMVLNPTSGAIAFWGSTTFTSPTAQLKLSTNALNEFGQRSKTGQTNTRIGEFMLSAISGMERNQLERDFSLSWTLFGDPALKLPAGAFSKPEPAPVQALPAPPRAPVAHKKGGGCSLMAADSTTASSPWDALAFVFEALIYMALYRQRKFLFGLFRGKS